MAHNGYHPIELKSLAGVGPAANDDLRCEVRNWHLSQYRLHACFAAALQGFGVPELIQDTRGQLYSGWRTCETWLLLYYAPRVGLASSISSFTQCHCGFQPLANFHTPFKGSASTQLSMAQGPLHATMRSTF